ncbi:MAG: hypothetical protein GIW98_02680 [Candidatus Eremiobacteraeota bacterium]|nr:hypothetical protein [Candidatus Eremiobacteraeota bacterium]
MLTAAPPVGLTQITFADAPTPIATIHLAQINRTGTLLVCALHTVHRSSLHFRDARVVGLRALHVTALASAVARFSGRLLRAAFRTKFGVRVHVPRTGGLIGLLVRLGAPAYLVRTRRTLHTVLLQWTL